MSDALLNDVQDAQTLLSLLESSFLRIEEGLKQLKKETPELQLENASANVTIAYKNLLTFDEQLSGLERVVGYADEKGVLQYEEVEDEESSSSEDDDKEFVFASESYKTPVRKPGRKLDFGTVRRSPFYTPQKKRGRKLNFGK